MQSKRIMLIVDNAEDDKKYLEDIFCEDFLILDSYTDLEAIATIEKGSVSIVMLNALRPNLNGFKILD